MRIAVYCSSKDHLPESWREAARITGDTIGNLGATLIYGGVDAGLMAETAKAAKIAGAKIVGIVPHRRFKDASPLNDMQVPTSDLNDRKGTMQLLADFFVVLPGGYGTLDEFSTSFSYINFNDVPTKQIILHNPDGLYDHLLEQLKKMASLGLMNPLSLDVIRVTSTPDELAEVIKTFAQGLQLRKAE